MTRRILITGGTGTLGRRLTPLVRAAGPPVRVLSRQARTPETGIEQSTGDLATGEGLAAAVEGVDTVLHCAGSATGDEDKARHLVRASSAAGVRHLVFISVVGADRVPVVSRLDRAMFGYFAAKRAAEQIVVDSGIPWTILRATQFHDLALATVRALARLPVVPVPAGTRLQPVAAEEVAGRLLELVLDRPAGLVPDLAGPRAYLMGDLVRGYLDAVGRRRPVLPIRMPGRAARALRAGANLAPDRAVGRLTWEEHVTGAAHDLTGTRGG